MERKLIFLDIDGTLISGLAKPSPLAVRAVRQARAMGHRVFLCTGRNLPIIVPDIRDIGFDGVIASAGAYVELEGQVLFDRSLPEEVVQECLEVFHENGLFCRIETREGIYTDPQMEALLRSAQPDPTNAELIRMQRELEAGLDLRPYDRYPRQGAYKICFTSTALEPVEEAQKRLGDRFTFVVYPHRRHAGCFNGEIIPKEIDKGQGIARICRRLGAKPSDTIAFGDSMNDEPMFRQVGVAIAMGNACEELKALADAVCEEVDEDGVYHELHRRGLC